MKKRTVPFISFIFFFVIFLSTVFLPILSMAGTVNLPQTGQTTCYDELGNVIDCAGTGQDGDIQAGVAWPSPRFTDHGDGTITDNLTGLMWAKDANLPGGPKTWQEALDYSALMNAGIYPNFGHTDWRLPNLNELESLLNANEENTATWLNEQGFTNVPISTGSFIYYWSSTSSAYDASRAWVVGMNFGQLTNLDKPDKPYYNSYVWPVRGTTTPPAQVWKTGQTKCYNTSGSEINCAGTGQDGEKRQGVDWPIPRFTDNGDGTVTDNLTGLAWTKDANAPGPATCNPATTKTWQEALDYVKCLNNNLYLGFDDWRLPNRKQLHCLTDFSQVNPGLPPGHPFTNVSSSAWVFDEYWSSTTYVYDTMGACVVDMYDGYVGASHKTSHTLPVWPVRSGQVLTVFQWPVDNPQITQVYACRNCIQGTTWRYISGINFHSGVDVRPSDADRCDYSRPVKATNSGWVEKLVGYADSYKLGNTVILRHDNGKYSLYSHLDSINPNLLPGDYVEQGDELGKMGNSTNVPRERCTEIGAGMGTHVHFEIKENPTLGDITDKFWGYTPGHPDFYGYYDPREYIQEITAESITPVAIKYPSIGMLNVRSSPGEIYFSPDGEPAVETDIIDQISESQEFVAFKKALVEGSYWYYIYLPSTNRPFYTSLNNNGPSGGWVFGEVVTEDQDAQQIEVLDDGVNVRGGPRRNFPILVKLYIGQRFVTFGTPISGKGCTKPWYKIYLPKSGRASEGWVCGDFIK